MMITVQPRREEALKAGFAALSERLPSNYAFGEFEEKLRDWDVSAFCDGERVVGMLMVKGSELHVAVLPEVRGKWLSRRLIREVFAPIIAAHGKARTSIAPDNARGLDFVRRIRAGFADLTYDPTSVLLSIGGSLLSGAIQGDASEKAAGQAASASNRATDTQLQMFNTQNAQQEPYRQTGYTALGKLAAGFKGSGPVAAVKPSFMWEGSDYGTAQAFKQANLENYRNITGLEPGAEVNASLDRYIAQARAAGGETLGSAEQAGLQDQASNYGLPSASIGTVEPGYFSHQFNAADLNANLAPNYEFMKQQGIGATQNLMNASGGSFSGNTLKGITDYATNFAQKGYQDAFSNYTANQGNIFNRQTANQTNIFNRLASIAGLGQTANAQSATLTGALAPSIAQSQIGAGQAQAAGTIGQANAFAGAGNNAMGWYQLGNLMNPSGGGGNNYNAAGNFQPYYSGYDSGGGAAYG